MPIISPIGRRYWRTRILIGAMYLALLAGSVAMIYPFLLMLAGSTKSAVDAPIHRIVPPFLFDRTALYQKHTEALFNEQLGLLQSAYGSTAPSFGHLDEPAQRPAAARAWEEFLRRRDPGPTAYTLGFVRAPASRGVQPLHLRAWKRELTKAYGGRIDRVNEALQTAFPSWYAMDLRPEDYLVRRANPPDTALGRAWTEYKERQPPGDRVYFSVEGFYRNVFLMGRYTRDLAAYNTGHGTSYTSWEEIRFDPTYPTAPGRTDAERADWESFVRVILNLQWIRADDSAAPAYHAYLAAKYGSLDALNRAYETAHGAWSNLPLPMASPHPTPLPRMGEGERQYPLPHSRDGINEPPLPEGEGGGEGSGMAHSEKISEGLPLSDWDAFVQGWRDPADGAWHRLPIDAVRIDSLEERFRGFLRERFVSIDELNRAWGTTHADWRDIALPQQALHYERFLADPRGIRWELATRNFATVWDYLGRHGRGLLNTAIYCGLAVLAALLVNPIAAYALSRYRPPFTYKVLLFLMLTMAFPPMVTQIPVFLLLRKFELLNTFWALVLPGLANGYAIFLLKGFFDSLPRELYESAEMDGAGEFRVFWTITMSLSKPILAVIALNAFTHAYSNFMFALLICQDPRMWTLMPWLYQLQQYSGPGVVYASLLIAAIPTLAIFTLCQKVIMRGIVVPVEK